jgi:acyl dehydratase
MRFFDDIPLGERILLGSHTFGLEEITEFARKFDPQRFHVDEEAARKSPYGRLCASGWHTSAICMRHTVAAKDREDAVLRAAGKPVARSGPSPGVRDVRWVKPVYPGDTITFESEIRDKRDSSRPGYGLLVTVTTGTNQNGELVYSVQGAVFIERRTG